MAAGSVLIALAMQAASLSAGLQPLEFLNGSCWRGSFPNRPAQTDTHCFAPMLGGAFLRDTHVVEGAPTPYSGESVYRLDRDSGEIRFHYYASDGGYSAGAATPTATGLDFPEESHRGANGAMTIRSRWTRDGADAYLVVSESRTGDSWRELWRMRMVRIGSAPPR